MMVGPTTYAMQFADSNYLDLIKERDGLLSLIREYEAKSISGERLGEDWDEEPAPEVCYQTYLLYLSELSLLMQEKYCEEYVHGGRKLSEDGKIQS